MRVGGGGLGVGLTGPTGGPVPGAADPEPGGRPGFICASKGWLFCIIANTESLRSLVLRAGATCCKQYKRAPIASLGRFAFIKDSSLRGPCKILGNLRWRYWAIALTKPSPCSCENKNGKRLRITTKIFQVSLVLSIHIYPMNAKMLLKMLQVEINVSCRSSLHKSH